MKELGAEAFPLLRKAAGADDLTPQATFGKAQVTRLLVILFQQIPGSGLMLRRGRPREKPEKATTEAVSVKSSLKELELCRFTAARLSSFH